MLTTVIARTANEDQPDEVIVDGWKDVNYIPSIGDRISCFEGVAKVSNRELRYDEDEHLTVILGVEFEKPTAQSTIETLAILGRS